MSVNIYLNRVIFRHYNTNNVFLHVFYTWYELAQQQQQKHHKLVCLRRIFYVSEYTPRTNALYATP